MAISFTPKQKKVLDARGHDVLVSAAAGSGKTAVLVERIVRLISEGDHPLSIDRLLVVTFTRAAAAQMRERIGAAISARLEEDPGNRHLQEQETLLHSAQITTIDSFCTSILRNHFSEIDLDPGFRQMDETESALLAQDVLEEYLEEEYASGDERFLSCADYFCPGRDDAQLSDMILKLYNRACSHPDPQGWLEDRGRDYDVHSAPELLETEWMKNALDDAQQTMQALSETYDAMILLCTEPGGPFAYHDFLVSEKETFFGGLGKLNASEGEEKWNGLVRMLSGSFGRLPAARGKKYDSIDPGRKAQVKQMRDGAKKSILDLRKKWSSASPEAAVRQMEKVNGHLQELVRLTEGFMEKFGQAKRDQNAIDFVDLEHLALSVVVKKGEDGSWEPRRTARAFREHFREILIDEYQDSNEVQELLLRSISGDEDGHYNRFMVGDVKQSIYKFRLARPEIFMEKYDRYRPDDEKTERIDLDQNFRSRREVLDTVNRIFMRIMRREIGGVDYNDEVSLKAGASFPESTWSVNSADDPYRSELLIVDGSSESTDGGKEEETYAEDVLPASELSARQREALAVAGRIREIVGRLPVMGEDGRQRPARYGDIVILLRSNAGWNEEFRKVFEHEGIPSYVESRTGYFSAQEVRVIMQFLRVINNPRQDIPLYGTLHGYFGGFSEDEIARIRAAFREEDLYTALLRASAEDGEVSGSLLPSQLRTKAGGFLHFLARWRERTRFLSVSELLTELIDETGYGNYCRALPGGEQRDANLRFLLSVAASFDSSASSGLFRFLRYIDQMHTYEVDFGEANTLDENADVVRIMSIHKSKGLEFPICFLCGLSKGFSFRRHDASGNLILDSDLGVGLDYYDEANRTVSTTLRKEAVAGHIRRDSLGEELRVLYVAMTRAKEKLIMTSYVRSYESSLRKWLGAVSGCPKKGHLPVPVISSAGSYMDLVSLAASADNRDLPQTADGYPLSVHVLHVSDLALSQLDDQIGLSGRKDRLVRQEEVPASALPDPSLAKGLERTLSLRYAHDDLRDLYTKTTVTELKEAQMENLFSEDEVTAETDSRLFAEDEDEIVPRFAAQDGGAGKGPSAASYGTAMHRIMELFDYSLFPEPSDAAEGQLGSWVASLADKGLITPEAAQAVSVRSVYTFAQSPLAKRMAAAAGRGELFREQPFVLGIPADRLDGDFPHEETVLIQGVMDAFFMEDGEAVLVDYKTDRVRSERILCERYRVQMEYYKEAIERIRGVEVREAYIYSFFMGKAVRMC